jgi:hypothetical protein
MEEALAKTINKHILGYFNRRRDHFILKIPLPSVPLSGFHQWADGRDFVGGGLVARKDGLAYWFLFLLWNDNIGYYLVIFPEDKSGPIAEIHRVKENGAKVALQWRYGPKKRDGKNQQRKDYFTHYFDDLLVNLPIPRQQSEVQNFLDNVFALAETRISADNLDQFPPSLQKVTTTALLSNLEGQIENEGTFEPQSAAQARERILRSVALRRGQREFRQRLIDAYGGRCAVTDCDAIDALEAAHILPFAESGMNSPKNGLLLRADIHTLFDLRLIAVDTTQNPPRLLLNDALRNTTYASLEGSRIRVPSRQAYKPSNDALAAHREEAGL